MESWGFYLPMASSILAVLWLEDFTVFDVRVCEELESCKLGDFRNLNNLITESLWPRYVEYCDAVRRAVPEQSSLRDKDRFLWGRSSAQQLSKQIVDGF
jgi:hypothetical protein